MKKLLLIIILIVFNNEIYSQSNWQFEILGGARSTEFLIGDDLSFVGDAKIFYRLSEDSQLSFAAGYHEWSEKYGLNGNHFKAIPIFGGIRFQILKGLLSPYLSGEFGLHFISRDFIHQVYERSALGLYRLISSEPATEKKTIISFRFAIGTTMEFYKNIGADLSLRYSPIRYDYVYSAIASRGTINLYDLIFGLYYKF